LILVIQFKAMKQVYISYVNQLIYMTIAWTISTELLGFCFYFFLIKTCHRQVWYWASPVY